MNMNKTSFIGNLLMVDADVKNQETVAHYLRTYGFDVQTTNTGQSALDILEERPVDVVVMDVVLPDEDGLNLCRRIRENSTVPLIFLTELDNVTDRVVALELGADDYLAKPFEFRELLARIRALLRREHFYQNKYQRTNQRLSAEADAVKANSLPRHYSFAGWSLDVLARELRAPDNAPVALGDAQFKLLMTFLAYPYQVLSREQLLNYTHDSNMEAYDRSIDILVSRLRGRLNDVNREMIKTIRSGGYMFTVDVSREGLKPVTAGRGENDSPPKKALVC